MHFVLSEDCKPNDLSLVMAALQTIKEGHLYKRGKINTDWRQRLFVLNGKQLSYFKGGVSTINMEYKLAIPFMAITRVYCLYQWNMLLYYTSQNVNYPHLVYSGAC